jgi:signal peptidase
MHKLTHIFSAALTLVIVGISLGASILTINGAKFLSVQSGSMVPTFNRGDLVIDTPLGGQALRQLAVGDVITYTNPAYLKGQPITHRLVQVGSFGNGNHFITKGDANTATDPPITAKNIVGKVTHSMPYVGYGFDFVRRPLGLALLIYLPALLIVAAEIRRLTAYYKDQEPYVAAGYQPAFEPMQPQLTPSRAYTGIKAGVIATIIALVVIVPTVQAALASKATLTPNTISTFVQANHLVIYQIGFGNGVSGACIPGGSGAYIYGSGSVVAGASCRIDHGSGASVGAGVVSAGGGSGGAFIGSGSSLPANQTVTIYNPTASSIKLAGYKLADNNGVRVVGSGTVNTKSYFVYTWPVYNGLSRNGDRMILRDATSSGIDSLSWGSDTSQLNPSVTVTAATSTLTRKAPGLDTNIATDWLNLH